MKVGDRVETPDGGHHDIIRITEDCGIQLSDYHFYCRSELKLVENKSTKTELIDKAIDDLGGDISNAGLYGLDGNIYLSYHGGRYVLCHKSSTSYYAGKYFCTIEEFEQRKKEREMEKNSNDTHWYDYKNIRMLKSPPVGEIVLVNTQSGERKAKVLEVTHNSTKEIFIVRVFNGSVEGVGDLQYKDEARPLDWDKLSNRNITVLHAMESVGNIHSYGVIRKGDLMALLTYLYDQGMLKLPEDK